jgi:hypothetical protein
MIKILQGGSRMRKIKIGSKVIFKKEYRKIAEKLGLTRVFTVKSIDSDDGVKFKEDKNPIVTISSDWLELVEEEKN